jgi:hypothetical protein
LLVERQRDLVAQVYRQRKLGRDGVAHSRQREAHDVDRLRIAVAFGPQRFTDAFAQDVAVGRPSGTDDIAAFTGCECEIGRMPDGRSVCEYVVDNGLGLRLHAINLGGIVTALHCPDRNGRDANVVLGFTDLAEGTVYALLVRIEQRGLVDVEKVPSEKGPPRKVYTLNASGRAHLQEFWRSWDFLARRLEQLQERGQRT